MANARRFHGMLTARAATAMDYIIGLTGESMNTTVASALVLYARIQQVIEDGGNVYVQERVDGPMQKVWPFI